MRYESGKAAARLRRAAQSRQRVEPVVIWGPYGCDALSEELLHVVHSFSRMKHPPV